jgi:hypothetical protein
MRGRHIINPGEIARLLPSTTPSACGEEARARGNISDPVVSDQHNQISGPGFFR